MTAEYLNATEVAALLGRSYRTIIRLVERGELPASRMGGRGDYVFVRSDVIGYLAGLVDQAQANLDRVEGASS